MGCEVGPYVHCEARITWAAESDIICNCDFSGSTALKDANLRLLTGMEECIP